MLTTCLPALTPPSIANHAAFRSSKPHLSPALLLFASLQSPPFATRYPIVSTCMSSPKIEAIDPARNCSCPPALALSSPPSSESDQSCSTENSAAVSDPGDCSSLSTGPGLRSTACSPSSNSSDSFWVYLSRPCRNCTSKVPLESLQRT